MKPEKQIFKQGFTLMELMVYMGLVGLVVVIAGEAFSNSSRFRVRTTNMIEANQEAENVAMLFKEDVEQLGTKTAKEAGSNTFTTAGDRIYMDASNADNDKKDSSSFRIEQSNGYSNLTFKRTRYDNNGQFQAIDSIRWYVENRVLKRSCVILQAVSGFTLPDGDPCVNEGGNNPTPVEMASNVSVFDVEAASPGTTEDKTQIFPAGNSDQFILFPRLDASGEFSGSSFTRSFVAFDSENSSKEPLGAGNAITLSGFWSNYENKEDFLDNAIIEEGSQKVNQVIALNSDASNLESSDWKSLCLKHGAMSFSPDTVYEISFIVTTQSSDDKSMTFVPAKDHMSVGFRRATPGDYVRSTDGTNRVIMSDFLFYPPLDNGTGLGEGKRSMRFTVPEKVEAVCLAVSFAFYSPLASMGHVTIKNLKVSQVATANYKFSGFVPESNIKEKKNVKALKLKLQVSRGGETGDVNLVVPIPSNGTGD